MYLHFMSTYHQIISTLLPQRSYCESFNFKTSSASSPTIFNIFAQYISPKISGNAAYEPGGMYILLSALSDGGMHWGIFVMVSPPFGMIYNATDSDGPWRLDEHMTENVASSQNILGGLLIQRRIDEDMQDRIHNVLTQVPCPPQGGYIQQWGENFRCRVWVKDAIERLRISGLIGNYPTEDIWDEAFRLGERARRNGQRGVFANSQALRH